MRSFTAPTMTEAMRQVREEMGENAIIVSTRRDPAEREVRVTAAVERVDSGLDAALKAMTAEAPSPPAPVNGSAASTGPAGMVVRAALAFHGIPSRLVDRLSTTADAFATVPGAVRDPGYATVLALAAALDARFPFQPLEAVSPGRPIMLVGPAGAGKTTTVAKLAARARLKGLSAGVISTDTARAGGVDQLEAFTLLLDYDLCAAEDPPALGEAVRGYDGLDFVFIDTPATNPFDEEAMGGLKAFIDAAGAEPVLVLSAGGDALECGEIGEFFGEVGAKRLLATRLDTARRFGGLVVAAEVGGLAFSEAGIAAQVANGLSPLTAMGLARLLLREYVDQTDPPTSETTET